MTHKSMEQLELYPPDTKFFIKAKNFMTGDVKILKDISTSDYEKSLKYLKHLNANGYNIFLSALAGGVYILLDDIKKPDIKRLFKDGFEPFYYLETSPNNFQVIIKLSDNPINKDIQTFISRQLAETYSADINSTDIKHFFRLAGFTNRKYKYCKNGLYPFVKLYLYKETYRKTASKGQEYIDRIIAGIENGYIELPNAIIPPPPLRRGKEKPKIPAVSLTFVKSMKVIKNFQTCLL